MSDDKKKQVGSGLLFLVLPIVYLIYLSNGLPNNLLGSAWPTLHETLGFATTASTTVFMVISIANIISNVVSDKMIRALGHAKLAVLSVGLVAVSIFLWAMSKTLWQFYLIAIPYGFGMGWGVAAANNYMVDHYKSFHLSWVNCIWAVGSALGGVVLRSALEKSWMRGYVIIGILEVVIMILIAVTIPAWKKVPMIGSGEDGDEQVTEEKANLTYAQIFKIPGVIAGAFAFFMYTAIENSMNMLAPTYMNEAMHSSAANATLGGTLFFVGLAVGRAFNGFLTLKFSDRQLIRMGEGVIALGSIIMIFTFFVKNPVLALVGIAVIGIGCAPINPSIVHSTPANFGSKYSQAVLGMELAFAQAGSLLMPKFCSFLLAHTSYYVFPIYLIVVLALMFLLSELVYRQTAKAKA